MHWQGVKWQDIKWQGMKWHLAALAFIVFIISAMPAQAQFGDPDQAGQATADDGTAEINDPLENVNRFFFRVNNVGDRYFLKPVAQGYDYITPDFLQEGIFRFLNNVETPVIFANDMLQGEVRRGAKTVGRFLINTTFGVAGFVDIADRWGLERHSEDFGQTLGVWGVGSGPYLYLPLLGPAPPRDLVGTGVDQFFDPLTYTGGRAFLIARASRTAVGLIDLRARNLGTIEEIERTSIDFYAAVRSLYIQSREGAIRNGEVDLEELPDFSDEFELEDFE